MTDDLSATRNEVIAWFFDDYLKRWVAASSGASREGPEFILDCWGVPMSVTTVGEAFRLLDAEGVLGFLARNQEPLSAEGYTHTIVPDRRVMIYSPIGAPLTLSGPGAAPTRARSSGGPRSSSSSAAQKAGVSLASSRSPPIAIRLRRFGRDERRRGQSFAEPNYPPVVMPAGVSRQALTIWCEGIALDGDIFRPENLRDEDKLPGVVLCHGWGAAS